jgi:hypothetical protein
MNNKGAKARRAKKFRRGSTGPWQSNEPECFLQTQVVAKQLRAFVTLLFNSSF